MRERRWAAVTAGATVLAAAGCDAPPLAMGDANSIVVTADGDFWRRVEADVVPALERTVFTVRDERTFKITHHPPYEDAWHRLKLLRQQLVVGRPSDPWIAEVLERVDEPVRPPEIVQTEDVWARNQLATAAVLGDRGDAAEQLRELLPALAELFDEQYRRWVVARMSVTGLDTALARSLREEAGFSLLVPNVYDYRRIDSVHIFRNDNPDPSELIRQFAVTWRDLSEGTFGADDLMAWRARLVETRYDYPQAIDRAREIVRPLGSGLSVQAVWENPPDGFPAAGPLIARTIPCPEQGRRYLIDAWLYAPGREKYEYMIQLEEILSSFECAAP